MIVLIMFVASMPESVIWAISYLALGAIENLESAVYFSLVAYTTLGYGEGQAHKIIALSRDGKASGVIDSANLTPAPS